jgi:hypothetical protein
LSETRSSPLSAAVAQCEKKNTAIVSRFQKDRRDLRVSGCDIYQEKTELLDFRPIEAHTVFIFYLQANAE